MTYEIENSKAVLDSRDIQERLDELVETFNDALEENGRNLFSFSDAYEKDVKKTQSIMLRLATREGYGELDYEFEEYHNAIEAFSELMDYSQWHDMIIFYNDSELDERWAEYKMQELGYIPDNLPSIISMNIDFGGILDDWKDGMSEIEFEGHTFWYDTF